MSNYDDVIENQRDEYKAKLMARRVELMDSIATLKSDVTSNDEKITDQLDIASKNEDRHRAMAELARDESTLKQVEFALRNFDDFGYCMDCGCEIGVRRLEIRPETTRCIDCQEKAEKLASHMAN